MQANESAELSQRGHTNVQQSTASNQGWQQTRAQLQYWWSYCHDHFAATALLPPPPPPPDCIDAILLCKTSVTCISWFLRSCAACARTGQQFLGQQSWGQQDSVPCPAQHSSTRCAAPTQAELLNSRDERLCPVTFCTPCCCFCT